MKTNDSLTQEDVRSIVKDELIDMGLDQVPKKLNLLDKILVSIDKLVGEVKDYREEQVLVSGKISEHTEQLDDHDTRIKQAEKTLDLRPTS